MEGCILTVTRLTFKYHESHQVKFILSECLLLSCSGAWVIGHWLNICFGQVNILHLTNQANEVTLNAKVVTLIMQNVPHQFPTLR